jgi:hypothetical protein
MVLKATAKPMPPLDNVDQGVDYLRQSGSQTVAGADVVATVGKVAVAVGAAAETESQTGALSKATDWVGQATGVKTLGEQVSDLGHWAASHWQIAAIVVGGLLLYQAYRVIAARVRDHQSGANTSR